MHDLLLRGGRVYDGTGTPPATADVAVSDGHVTAVGAHIEGSAAEVVDAAGLDVVPGFIDLHGHSDFALTIDPSGESLLHQGVTTQLVGNCGTSAFPLRAGVPSPKFDPTKVSRSWQTAAQYFDALAHARPSPNVGSLVGLGTVRRRVLDGADRPASDIEQDEIVAQVDDALAAGALGVSLGLHFEPDLHATPQELLSVSRTASARKRPVTVHLRDHGDRLQAAIDEALSLGRSTGAAIHISLLHAFGRSAHGRIAGVIETLDAARAGGVAVTCEALLWPTVGAWHGLRAVLPPEAHDWQAPDWPSLRGMASAGPSRDRLAQAIEARRAASKAGFYEEYIIFSDWRDLRLLAVADGSAFGDYLNQSLDEIAQALDRPPVDVFLDLVVEDPSRLMVLHQTLSQEDIESCLQWPHAYVGLDAIATSRARHRELWNTMQFHPRHFGGVAWLFAAYVRAASLVAPEEAVRRLTSGPAALLGLHDRGVLREGSAADIVLLDLARFEPTGTWLEPVRVPAGVVQVFVNGTAQLSDGASAGTGSGEIITRMSD